MREPNLGITVTCLVCGKSFWCEDGIRICSSKCNDQVECECGNEKEIEETHCEECLSEMEIDEE